MQMIKLFPVSEVPENARKVVNVGEYKVLIIHSKGKFFAVDNHCPHMSFPLNLGKVTDDCTIICAFHHSAFDLESGDVKEWSPWPPLVGKSMGALVRKKALPVFTTEVKEGALWISSEPKA